jgi:hypothetical protein
MFTLTPSVIACKHISCTYAGYSSLLGVAKRLFSLCDPNLQVLSVNLTSAQAPQPLIGRLVSGSSLTSKDFKTLYESYSHTLHGTVSLRKLNLVYQLKIIMKIAMSRYVVLCQVCLITKAPHSHAKIPKKFSCIT